MNRLFFENVRCFFTPQSAPLRPLTLLVGKNSSGKSTFMALVRLAWDLCQGITPLDLNEEPFLLGAYDQVASYRRGRAGRAQQFSIGAEIVKKGPIRRRSSALRTIDSMTVRGHFVRKGGQPHLREWVLEATPFRIEIIYLLAFRIFTSPPENDFRPVFDWLHAPDKNGCLVFGGRLSKELSNRTASRRYLRALLQAGRAYRIPDVMVQSEERQGTVSGLCRSNDPHVIALARVSGARTLYSHDKALHQDFRNRELISNPRVRVYQDATHTDLLHHDPPCPRGGRNRRRRS